MYSKYIFLVPAGIEGVHNAAILLWVYAWLKTEAPWRLTAVIDSTGEPSSQLTVPQFPVSEPVLDTLILIVVFAWLTTLIPCWAVGGWQSTTPITLQLPSVKTL